MKLITFLLLLLTAITFANEAPYSATKLVNGIDNSNNAVATRPGYCPAATSSVLDVRYESECLAKEDVDLGAHSIYAIEQKLAEIEEQFDALDKLPIPTDGAKLDAKLDSLYQSMWRIRRSINAVENVFYPLENSEVFENYEDRHKMVYVRYLSWRKYLHTVLHYPVPESMVQRVSRYASIMLRYLVSGKKILFV
jgi:hypothetical protein